MMLWIPALGCSESERPPTPTPTAGGSAAAGGAGGTAGSGLGGHGGAGGPQGPCDLTTAPTTCDGDCHYVWEGATGAATGSSWTDAWTTLPDALERGHVYFVAAGQYPAVTFDDDPSGAEVTTIKRATAADHGTDDGWTADLDSGPAVFDDPVIFRSSYWRFDGMRGQGTDSSSYGFRITPLDDCAQDHRAVQIGQLGDDVDISDVTLAHTEIATCGEAYDPATQICVYSNPGSAERIAVAGNYLHGSSANMLIRQWSSSVIECNTFAEQWSSENHHGEQISPAVTDDITLRYNVFLDSRVGVIGFHSCNQGACPSNVGWQVYGNLVLGGDVSMGAFGNAESSYPDVILDCAFHHNTFVGVTGSGRGSAIYVGEGTGNSAYNNLWVDCVHPVVDDVIDHDHNSFFDSSWLGTGLQPNEIHGQIATGDPLVDSAAGDCHLASPTEVGTDLPAPFDVDPDGRARGADGHRDRGAYEHP